MKHPPEYLNKIIQYQFNNPELLETALRHRSAGSNNNERLEFIGDSILGFVISDILFAKFPDVDEGSLTRRRAHLVKGDSLAAIAAGMELGEYLALGSGEMKSGGHRRGSILADALEAIIGAIYLDGGIEPSRKFIQMIYADKLSNLDELQDQKDPKTRLQEMLQGKNMTLPTYNVTSIEGNPPSQHFSVICELKDMDKTVSGEGKSRRKAEQDAASRAIKLLTENG